MINITIECERCGDIGAKKNGRNKLNIKKMREELEEKDWITLQTSGVDLCPNCRGFWHRKR